MFSRFIHTVADVSYFIPFHGLIVSHCRDTPCFVLFIHSQFRLFPLFGYKRYCCYEHLCTSICVFNSLGCIKNKIVGSYEHSAFKFLGNCQTIFQSSRTILHSHQKHKSSDFSTLLPILVIDHFLDSSHPSRYEVVSHCVFDMHFP